MALEPGAVFAGYRVLSQLGEGGMGQVYLVENLGLQRREALKLISAAAPNAAEFQQRFEREAQTAAALDHPAIITIHHYGVENGTPWFTMRHVAGRDLSGARLPVPEVVQVIREVADALDYANARGVVHRDIKPANIIVTRDDRGAISRVTVLDFGIARLAGAQGLTGTRGFVGTLSYSAPELIDGLPPTAAADQYSLACTAYEMLAGMPPYTEDSIGALVRAHSVKPVPPLSWRRPDLAALDRVFARALAKRPEERYPSCRAFAQDLAAASRGSGAVPAPYSGPVPSGPVSQAAPPVQPGPVGPGTPVPPGPPVPPNVLTPSAPVGPSGPLGMGAPPGPGPGPGPADGQQPFGSGETGQPAARGKRGVLIASIVAAVVVIALVAGGVAYVLTRGDDKGRGTAQDATGPATTTGRDSGGTGPGTTTGEDAPSGSVSVTPSPGQQYPTIDDYLTQNGIARTAVAEGVSGAPDVAITVPDGWRRASSIPANAIDKLAYSASGDGAADITVHLYRLSKRPDEDALFAVAGGDARNLSGFQEGTAGPETVSGFPSYRIVGAYADGSDVIVVYHQVVLIKSSSGTYYLLELVGNGTSDLAGKLGEASVTVVQGTRITA